VKSPLTPEEEAQRAIRRKRAIRSKRAVRPAARKCGGREKFAAGCVIFIYNSCCTASIRAV
jgi:hypothetical protein